MFTALLGFLKGKVFSQAGSFLLPVLGLLAVFLIWNSDLILTKFGYETRSNLKAEVTRLNGELEKVMDANRTLSEAAAKNKEDTEVVISVVEDVAENKADTKNTVSSIQADRKKKAEKLLNSCSCESVPIVEVEKETINDKITSTLPQSQPKTTSQPLKTTKAKQVVSQEIVDRLSEDNIDAINIAYSSFFPETSK